MKKILLLFISVFLLISCSSLNAKNIENNHNNFIAEIEVISNKEIDFLTNSFLILQSSESKNISSRSDNFAITNPQKNKLYEQIFTFTDKTEAIDFYYRSQFLVKMFLVNYFKLNFQTVAGMESHSNNSFGTEGFIFEKTFFGFDVFKEKNKFYVYILIMRNY